MSQTDLGRFGESADRPTAEARAVADDTPDGATVVDPDAEPSAVDGTVELGVVQVNYTVEGTGDDERPVIHLFGRTPEAREPVHVVVGGFRPYFYVPTEDVSEDTLAPDALLEAEDGYTSIRGEPLTRIYARTPRDVGELRDRFTHFEADVPFPSRFLIDKGIRSGVRVPERRRNGGIVVTPDEVEPIECQADPRVHMLDIEVDDRDGFPEEGEQPILCLSAHDSYRDEYVVWLYVAPHGNGKRPEVLPGHDLLDDGASVDVRCFDEEGAMLDDYLTYLDTTDPDLVSGWNVDDFDLPYLLDRLEIVDRSAEQDLSIERLSRVDEVWRNSWQGPNVKGRVVFDLLYAYRRTQFSELDSYRLDAVGEEELGVRKERYTGSIGDLWEQHPERLLEYNLRDVEICVEIDRQQEVIAFWDEVRSFVGCKLEDAPTPGDAVDVYVLQKVHGEFVLPSKGQAEGEQYEGGAVFDPITGVREMVSVLDLKSLYPMAMTTINASPETKVDPNEYSDETYRAPNGMHFRKDPDGIIREMVDELLTEREQRRDKRNTYDPGSSEFQRFDRQQGAVKVIMNCFSSDTDVLTPGGIRNIRNLDVGDEVYSLDPETMTMEVKPVVETHAYPNYRGELVDIQTSKIDFRVTPNHRMLVRKNDKNGITETEWSFVEANDLYNYCHYELPHNWKYQHGDPIERFDITKFLEGTYQVWVRPSVHGRTFTAKLGWQPPRISLAELGVTGYVFSSDEFENHREYIESVCAQSYVHSEPNRKWIPRLYEGDDFLQLTAWYISEGNVYTSKSTYFGDQYRGSSTTVRLSQQVAATDGGEDDHHASIGSLLERMGFDCVVHDRGYQFTSKLLGYLLYESCGGNSFEKRIPDFVFELDRRQKRLFLDTLIDGDGDWQKNAWRFTTASTRLRDDVLRLCLHLGLSASYNRDSGAWRIYCTEGAKNSFRMYRSGSRGKAEDGVYCVTVQDNHTLVAGRNGKLQPVGQSLYGVLGWDRFRLYDSDMGAAVTATGREVISYTDEVVEENGYEVIYGDTDSVMISIADAETKDEVLERSFEMEETINESYDTFALEQLNAHTHRFQIEFEKLYRRFFQAGKKKRYAGHIVWSEGKDVDDVDITGFEYQRSDIAPITKEVQLEVIERIVTGDDLAADREAIKTYLSTVIEDFLAGEADRDDIGIPGGIGKRLDEYETDTAHVRGAKYANQLLGTNFGRGSKPKRYYLSGVHPSFFRTIEADRDLDPRRDPIYGEFKRDPDVICVEFAEDIPDAFEIDYEKMLDRTLRGPIERILEALDLSWEEIKSGQQQTGLGQFG